MKLYEARRELESSNRIIRQEMADYYGMWVHQIKTPIAAMHVLLQASEECRLNAEDQAKNTESGLYAGRSAELGQYVREMKMELFNIEQYVEMVLTYLRMEEMSSDLSFEVCSLDSVIKQAVRKYSQMFIFKKIKLEYTPVETKVLTDEKWLEFVIGQILSNALKYSESGGTIRIDTKKCEDALILSIADEGIGISLNDLSRIFDKGFTGHNGRNSEKATGMGLYLCKLLCDKLHLNIQAVSVEGQGTTIRITFPINTMLLLK